MLALQPFWQYRMTSFTSFGTFFSWLLIYGQCSWPLCLLEHLVSMTWFYFYFPSGLIPSQLHFFIYFFSLHQLWRSLSLCSNLWMFLTYHHLPFSVPATSRNVVKKTDKLEKVYIFPIVYLLDLFIFNYCTSCWRDQNIYRSLKKEKK